MHEYASKIWHSELAALLAALSSILSQVHAQSFESIQHIEALARAEGARHLPAAQEHQRLQVGPLDGRLQLATCPVEPATQLGPGTHPADRVLVEISCSGGTHWRTYVPVRMVGLSTAVVSTRLIQEGHVIDAQDVAVVDSDGSLLPLGYFADLKNAVGLTASHTIGPRVVLTAQQFSSAKSISRGQEVTLVASGSGIDIRVAGRAMSDGYVNQRIKVQNTSSGKVVEGIARSDRVVEISLQ